MKDEQRHKAVDFLRRNTPVLLVALLGIALMLLPGGCERSAGAQKAVFETEEQRLAAVLSEIDGVGNTAVLLRQGDGGDYLGAVIVCTGAEQAQTRLKITQSVAAFTGLGSDKIIVMKSKMQGGQ